MLKAYNMPVLYLELQAKSDMIGLGLLSKIFPYHVDLDHVHTYIHTFNMQGNSKGWAKMLMGKIGLSLNVQLIKEVPGMHGLLWSPQRDKELVTKGASLITFGRKTTQDETLFEDIMDSTLQLGHMKIFEFDLPLCQKAQIQ